jgi:ABC-type transport system substrate-binding protein
MRRFGWRSVVVSSMILGALAANAGTRPQYGGTLHIATRAALASLDPVDFNPTSSVQPDSIAERSVTMLIFDTLVTIDENLRIQPSLATSWQVSSGGQRWQFRIRRGVQFHDGTPLSTEIAAASLRAANPEWKVSADADSVSITRDKPDPELLAELALPRNAIVKRNPESAPSGTGPFHVADWQPGKKLAVAAEENCWRGRPFLDALEIEMGQSLRDQTTSLELGRADLVEVAAGQTQRMSREGRRLNSSMPIELFALLFSRDAASSDEKLLRAALALSVERGSIRSVLLQGAGQPTAGILPNWMSGYGFVFPVDADLPRARHAHEQVHTIPSWTVGYDGSDPVARLLAERIALNAKDAGLSMQPTSAPLTDLKLVRIPLASPDAWVALTSVAALTGMPAGTEGGSVEDLYASEKALLATQRMIPLFHLPVFYAASSSLNNWGLRPDGSWNLADAWLGSANHDR